MFRAFFSWVSKLFEQRPMTKEDWQALIDSGEPILHTDANGRQYLRAKTGPNTYDEWYI